MIIGNETGMSSSIKQLQQSIDKEANNLSINPVFTKDNIKEFKTLSIPLSRSKNVFRSRIEDAKEIMNINLAPLFRYCKHLAMFHKNHAVLPRDKNARGVEFRKIGEGADGKIYLVKITKGEKLQSLIIKLQLCGKRGFFNQELSLMKIATKFALQGIPHFPILYGDVGHTRGQYCGFAMEVALCDLSNGLRNKVIDLSLFNGLAVMKQIVLCVRYFHAKMHETHKAKIVHCDFHNSNILLFPSNKTSYTEYRIDSRVYKVPNIGVTLCSYDYARVGSQSCIVSVAYDFLRAFSPHAGFLRGLNEIEYDRKRAHELIAIRTLQMACTEVLGFLFKVANLRNIVANGDLYDWDLGRTHNPDLESDNLTMELMAIIEKYEDALIGSKAKLFYSRAPRKIYNFSGEIK